MNASVLCFLKIVICYTILPDGQIILHDTDMLRTDDFKYYDLQKQTLHTQDTVQESLESKTQFWPLSEYGDSTCFVKE